VEHINHYTDQLKAIQEQPLGYSSNDLEARFSRIRTEETNIGNMIADMIRTEYKCDFGLINGGSIRANSVLPKGIIKNKYIRQILPNNDFTCFLKVPGRTMHHILENGLSFYPKYDGRWPCTSGLKFHFDPDRLI
jgi:5'-nucleotidase